MGSPVAVAVAGSPEDADEDGSGLVTKPYHRSAGFRAWTITAAVVLVLAAVLTIISLPRPVRSDLGLVTGTDRFSYRSWHTEMELVEAPQGVTRLYVTETLVARFPNHDQNKGLVRGIPVDDPSHFAVQSVQDANGAPVPYRRVSDPEHQMEYLLLGDESYVNGEHTYVIRYEVIDPIVTDPEHGVEELSWDLLPLDSAQPIDQFSATLRVAPEYAEGLTGDHACHQGRYGSTDTCELTRDGDRFRVASGHRAAGDGVTIAIGFRPGTFPSPRPAAEAPGWPPPWLQPFLASGTVGVGLVALGLLVVIGGRMIAGARSARQRAQRDEDREVRQARSDGRRPVPQAGVPATLPPPVAAAVLEEAAVLDGTPPPPSWETLPGRAELIHLAVRGAIRFEDVPDDVQQGDGVRGRLAIRLVDRELASHRVGQTMLRELFPGGRPMTLRPIIDEDAAFVRAVRAMPDQGRTAAREQGLIASRPVVAHLLVGLLGVAIAITGFVTPFVAGGGGGFVATASGVGVLLALILGFRLVRPRPTFTEEGRQAEQLLESVRCHLIDEYANRRRHAIPGGGTEPVRDGDVEVLQVYESLLPYAVLMGMAEPWGDLLASRYETGDVEPVWMRDLHIASDDDLLRQRLRRINATVQTSAAWTPPPSTTGGGVFGGGSSGGGFSGGGGGGGFSGGR